MLSEGIKAVIKKDAYEVPAIFKLMQKTGNIDEQMMYNTYNMGIGMIMAVKKDDLQTTIDAIKASGELAYELGYCKAGEKGVELI